ncbi:MAG TPA: arabinan endo-1,5-alpha-L-arabinosidase, partial [Polyangiaceae bacterium]|nr:arabinan endo-1,5-alpha-L-arabinosidase [Polyangiaceae bacterium]
RRSSTAAGSRFGDPAAHALSAAPAEIGKPRPVRPLVWGMPCVVGRLPRVLSSLFVAFGCSGGSPADRPQTSAAGSGGAPNPLGPAGAPSAVSGTAGENATGAGGATAAGASGRAGAVSGAGQGGSAVAGNGGANAGGSAGFTQAGSGGAPFSYPPKTSEHRAIGTHDPSMIRVASSFYLFATGGLLSVRTSSDFAKWTNAGNIFTKLPAWIERALGQTISDLWAPDVSFVNGTYRVYYAGSTFGSNHSVIGLATNTTLDPKNPAYAWVDEGLVLESNPAGEKDDWNAIDPNATLDADGNWWLVFGSFWSGIKLRRLDVTTGKLSSADTKLYGLAAHSGGIEAPSIVAHNGYYYLFVSYDACCKGVDSTYRTMVGRAPSITGPYSDDSGKAMLQGNAVQLLDKDGRYIGPGGGTAFRDGDQFFYAYHYYDGQMNGASELMLRPIEWKNDWPELGPALWQ